MKNLFSRTIVIAIVTCLFSCKDQKNTGKQETTKQDTVKQNDIKHDIISLDTSQYKIDTVFDKITIGETTVSVSILRDKYDAHSKIINDDDVETSPVTIIVRDNSNTNIIFKKTFGQELDETMNMNYNIFKAQNQPLTHNGKLYFTLFKNAGGSGSTGDIYFLDFTNGAISFNFITKTNEISDIVINNSDNEILLMEGKWGTGESHFDKHKYSITRLELNNNSFQKKETFQTAYAYPSLGDVKPAKEILMEINSKEPKLLGNINLSGYTSN